MKTHTIIIDGIKYTAPVTVCNPRKARGSNTFSRHVRTTGRDCARARFGRKTEIATQP